MNIKKNLIRNFLGLSLLVSTNIAYAENGVNVDIQSAILVKSLSYNKSLSGSVSIAALFNPSSGKSQTNKNSFLSNINSLKGSSDKQISVSAVDSISDLKSKSFDIVYIADDVSSVAEIQKLAQSKKFLTWSSNPSHVKEGIASISVMSKSNKPKIIVNLETMKSEGQSLSSNMLKLCEVVN